MGLFLPDDFFSFHPEAQPDLVLGAQVRSLDSIHVHQRNLINALTRIADDVFNVVDQPCIPNHPCGLISFPVTGALKVPRPIANARHDPAQAGVAVAAAAVLGAGGVSILLGASEIGTTFGISILAVAGFGLLLAAVALVAAAYLGYRAFRAYQMDQ